MQRLGVSWRHDELLQQEQQYKKARFSSTGHVHYLLVAGSICFPKEYAVK